MHISEGFLSGPALFAGWAIAGAGTAVGLKKLKTEKIVRTALISSAFFLASLVNVRVGPSSTHLTLIAPMGLMLGWSAFPAVVTALLLQALLFHFGGLVVLGANATIMGGSALVVWLLLGRAIDRARGTMLTILAFLAGALGVLIGATVACAFLWMTSENFLGAAKVFFLAHIPVALIEGIVTAFVLAWMWRVGEPLGSVDTRLKNP